MPRSQTATRTAAKPSRHRRYGRIAARILVALLLGPMLLILLFRFVPVPVTPLMLLRLAQGYGLQHHWVPYDRIAPSLAEAVIASEDNLFCREQLGFDWDALAGQFTIWSEGERPRGASTITMQTARNLLLLPGRDMVRKAIEAWLTPQIALLWPKQRVLEVYLNSIEFGPGIYGAEAASRHAFSHSAAALTRDQALRLAVVLPDPLHWSAEHPTAYLRERAETIGRRIGQLGPLLDCAH
jgi:monofunctional biosynthetic peptidoglycan transglycosylase